MWNKMGTSIETSQSYQLLVSHIKPSNNYRISCCVNLPISSCNMQFVLHGKFTINYKQHVPVVCSIIRLSLEEIANIPSQNNLLKLVHIFLIFQDF